MLRTPPAPRLLPTSRSPAPLRVPGKRPLASARQDAWEDEAEALAAWLARHRSAPGDAAAGGADIHPVTSERADWGTPIDPALAARARWLPGRPLDPTLRADFEQQLGHDLGDVRVHDGSEARELARSLGAEAFTVGQHIVTTSTERPLLAHEVVHTVQQATADPEHATSPTAPGRMQASFDKTTAELDPQVEILLDLHLRSRGKQLKDIAETKLLVSGSWWQILRAKLEDKAPAKPPDAKAEVEAAVKAIRDYKALDTAKGDPIQNGVAGLLADYLRINEAPELAALVVIEFPYLRTAVPANEVVAALATEKKRGGAAVVALPRIWKYQQPKIALADTWSAEITDVVDKFLGLTPLELHAKQRQALVDRLGAELRAGPEIPASSKAGTPFERLTDKSTLQPNELDVFARNALFLIRALWCAVLKTRIQTREQNTTKTPFGLWEEDVEVVSEAVARIGTANDLALQVNKVEGLTPVIETAHALLKPEITKPVESHAQFWDALARSILHDSPGEEDKYLKITLGEMTYAQLFFNGNQGADLATELQDIVRPLADAAKAYLDLFGTAGLPPLEKRATVPDVFAFHPPRAEAFRATLHGSIIPALVAKLHRARIAGKTDLAHGLGWLTGMIQRIHNTSARVESVDAASKPEKLIDTIERRHGIAMDLWELARDALGKSGADIYASLRKPEDRTTVKGKENVPAGAAWQALMDRAESAAIRSDIRTGLLVLPSGFQPSERAGIDQLAEDTSSGTVVEGLEPFTGSDLVLFYSMLYHRDFASELTALSDEALAAEAGPEPRDREDLWLVQRAADALKAREGTDALPKRYTARSVYWVPYAADLPRAFGRILRRQPAYDAFVEAHETRFNVVLNAVDGPDERGDAWAWTLPVPGALVAPLYEIDYLRGLEAMAGDELAAVVAQGAASDAKNAASINAGLIRELTGRARELGRTIRADTPPKQGYYNWYAGLNHRVKTIREKLGGDYLAGEAVQKTRKQTRESLTSGRALAQHESRLAQRRATSLDRRILARMNRKLFQDAVDRKAAGYAGIGYALDNHDTFRGAVRPHKPESEVKRQSAALVLEDAQLWLEMMGEAAGSYKWRGYTILSEAVATFPELLIEPRPTQKKDPLQDMAEHAQGIAWETTAERTELAGTIATFTPRIKKLLAAKKDDLRPLQWELGITGRKSGDPAHGTLVSHLSPGFPLHTSATIQEANAREKNEEKHKSDLIPIGGPLFMKVVNVHQDFTFLPGIGDRVTATADWIGDHALYLPAEIHLGIAADSRGDLGSTASHTENPKLDFAERQKKDKGAPLVDVEIYEGDTLFSRFTVHATDLEGSRGGLNWLAATVHNATAREKFASMAADIEMFAHALLFVASLYPPTALAVTAAEVLAFLGKVLADPEFKEALESIWNDPIEALKHASAELKAQFTVGRLFDLLLNGNFEPDRFLGAASLRGKNRSNQLTRGRMGKVLTRVKRIGAVFAHQLEGFQEGVQGPVHRIESLMGRNPRLATMVQWLGGHLSDLSDPEGMVLRHPLAGPIYEAYTLYRQLGRDDAAASAIGQPLGDVAGHLQTGIDRMAEFQLPATILPLDLAIEALIDIVIKLAPKSGKIGLVRGLAKMGQEGLRATGANSVVYGFLAEQITDTWADPNVYWQKDVVPLLEPPVKGAIQSTAESLAKHLSRAPLIGDYFGQDKVKGAKVAIPSIHRAALPNGKAAETARIGVADSLDSLFDSPKIAALVPEESGTTETRNLSYSDVKSMPDVFIEGIQKKPGASSSPGADTGGAQAPAGSPSPTPGGASLPASLSPAGHSSSAFTSTSGAPLAPAMRSEAERSFGHSFSHVRLHQGNEAWGATVQRGADALTAGNHVFLRPDLSPTSGRGRSVMQHELAHVLQKTSGAAPSARPPRGGIRWRPSEERAADRMAEHARHNASGRPIRVEGAHRDGASPAIGLDLMETFFKKLSSPSAGSSLAETIERAHARHKAADVHPDTLTAAENLWKTIRAQLFGPPAVASHFKGSQQRLKAHLENRLATLTRDGESVPAAGKVIAHLAALSEKDATPPPGDKTKTPPGAGTPSTAKPTFDAAGFLADLALYITGRSGIVFDFGLTPAEITKLKTNPSAKVTVDTKVRHVELLFVSNLSAPGLELWDTAIANTAWHRTDDSKDRRDALRKVLETEFHAAAPASTHSDEAAAAGGGKETAAPKAAKGGERGSYTPLWDTSKADLTLNATYIEKVETQLQPAALSSDLMPAWGYFAAPATEKFATVSSSTSQVQRNAVHWKGKTHEELTGGAFFLDKNDRNSHHIVQYLLPEYFANIKEFQPFPKLGPGRGYPGVKPAGTRVDTITGDGQSIAVAQTEAGSRRGHKMPAILLSADTHQNAGLHVTPKPDDTGKASQGYAIHREFRNHLAAAVARHLGVKREGDALDDYLVHLGSTHAQGEAAVVDAVRRTYAWLKDQNAQNLLAPEGMPGHEADFYISQFRGTDAGKKNFKALNGQDYETGSADIRTRMQKRLQIEAQSALDTAIATLAQAPLGWKLPGA